MELEQQLRRFANSVECQTSDMIAALLAESKFISAKLVMSQSAELLRCLRCLRDVAIAIEKAHGRGGS